MQNLIPLSFLDEAKSTEISQLSSEDLRSLMERLTEMAECLKKRKTLLEDGLNLKFTQTAQDRLKLDGRDTGTIRFDDGAYTIVAEMPKKVVWDQEKLETIIDKIPAGERKHYVKATYAIDERKYLSWSDDLRKFFDEARSVHLGKPKFQIIDGVTNNEHENYQRRSALNTTNRRQNGDLWRLWNRQNSPAYNA